MARSTYLALIGSLALVHAAGLALARPMEDSACTALKAELATLNDQGVRREMEKGPEWAKANLSQEKLAKIARLIEVDEGILFRCPRPKPVAVAAPKDGQADAAGERAPAAKAARPKAKSNTAAGELVIDPGLIELLNPPPDAPKPAQPAKKKAAAVNKKAPESNAVQPAAATNPAPKSAPAATPPPAPGAK